MKKTGIIYWTSTLLFSLFMASTAWPDVAQEKETLEFMRHLGYPDYFTFFIGVAKLMGCAVILIPRFHLLKEWAYAGLCFDLIGAVYSILSVEPFQGPMLFMLVPFALGITSYIYNRKNFRQTNN